MNKEQFSISEILIRQNNFGIFTDFIPKVRILEQELIQKTEAANEFIKDIAKLLGEDDLGNDGKSWSINDFSEAIQKTKDDERNRIVRLIEEKIEIEIDNITGNYATESEIRKSNFKCNILQEAINLINNPL